MTPDEHVAGPGRGQAGRPGGGEQHPPVGVGHHGRRALQQHDRARVAPPRARTAAEPVGLRGSPEEPGELAVVRGEHDRRRPAGDDLAQRRRPPQGVEPVGVDDHGHPAPRHGRARSDGRRARPRPSPGPMTSARHRSSRLQQRRRPNPRPAGRGRPPRSAAWRRGVGAGDAQADVARRRPAWRARLTRCGAPIIPGEPATTATADCHLWRVARPRRAARRPTSLVLDQPAIGPRDPTSRPMSATSTGPARSGPSPSSSPGLSAAKVTVASARRARRPASPVSPSTPDGMSTASTGAPPGSGGVVARRGSRCRRRRR